MTTAIQIETERNIFARSANRDYTAEEYDSLVQELLTAYDAANWDEFSRIGRSMPFEPVVAKAIKKVYGKEALLARGYDLTEANREFGEGWLDES